MNVVESDWEVPEGHARIGEPPVKGMMDTVPRTVSLNHPLGVEQRLEDILRELGERLNPYEQATEAWIRAKRDREKAKASAFLTAKGSVAARNAIAEVEAHEIGLEAEAAYMARKGALEVYKAMATACESLLRTQREVK